MYKITAFDDTVVMPAWMYINNINYGKSINLTLTGERWDMT